MNKFVGVNKSKDSKNNTIYVVDGYSTSKTELGLVRDIEKAILPYSELNSSYFHFSNKKEAIDGLECYIASSNDCFSVDIQHVSYATKYISDDNITYSKANYYFCVMFLIK